MDHPAQTRRRLMRSSLGTGVTSFLATCSIIFLSHNLEFEGTRIQSVVAAATDLDCS